jgi:ATP-dependent Clp protease adaptor protein ClpS
MELPEDHKLILYNDDKNSFSYVTACLIRYCGHEPQQAEQCVLVADLAGKCTIKHGCWAQIETMRESLEALGLKVKMEEYEGDMPEQQQ